LIQAYYLLGTPLFVLADLLFGSKLRLAAVISDGGWRATYYLFCAACALVCWRSPKFAPLAALGESSVNALLLVLSVLLPVLQAPAQVLAGEQASILTPDALVNLCLTGGMLALSFHRGVESLRRP
jgi:hypothetical protein